MRVAVLLAAVAALWVQPAAAVTTVNVGGTVTPNAAGVANIVFDVPGAEWPMSAVLKFATTGIVEYVNREQKGPFYQCSPTCVYEGMTADSLFPEFSYDGETLTFQTWQKTDYWLDEELWTFQQSRQIIIKLSGVQAPFEYTGVLTRLPEPATWALMMLGVGLTGFALRRRRQLKVQLPPLPAFAPEVRPAP